MAQQSHSRVRDLLPIEAHVRETYKLDPWWTVVQVEHAVLTFGARIEAMLNEIDDRGKAKYTLSALLKPRSAAVNGVTISRLSHSDNRVQPRPQMRRNHG